MLGGAGGPGGRGNAGYNQESFFHAGREEPLKGGQDDNEAWDVYADFNNAGPRYSSAYGPMPTGGNNQGYHQLPPQKQQPQTPLTPKYEEETVGLNGPVEMVTVPALGPEWKRSEMEEMTKKGRRAKKRGPESRMSIWRAWNRDQRGICFPWLTRRVFVFIMFAIAVVIGVLIAVCLPRVPSFAFQGNRPLVGANGTFANSIPIKFSRAPTNFTFPAYAQIEISTQANYLPLTITHLDAKLYDLETNRQVAFGTMGKKTFPAKSYPQFSLPMNFTYTALNDSDPTWKSWYDSCKNRALYADGQRPAVKFRLIFEMSIRGLIGSKAATTQSNSAECPIQLPQNAS
jgi:hypothetical protein